MTDASMEDLWARLRKLHEFNITNTKEKCEHHWIRTWINQDNPREFEGQILCSGFYGKLYHRERSFQTLLNSMEAELRYNEEYAMKSGFQPLQK